jgi:DNA-binding HxlR family transcriptional regulator
MSPRCRSCSPIPSELRAVADLLERRWTLGTIYASASGAVRFNEFRQSLPGISPTTLSDRLEQLEEAGIVERRLVQGRPPHAEYRLTRRGERLAAAVGGLLQHRSPA